ncbi:MAG TPA: complex I subunit 1 family protein [Phycisphaerae bacterium]|nr:complex I subunit 1 family protein [Phycisphaerae bacterium]
MDTGWILLTFLAAAAGSLVLGLLLRGVDRKVTARVQWRVGPPLYQPLIDVIKLTGKETLMPVTARRTGFLLAPMLALAATGVAAVILWRALLQPEVTFMGDLIVVVYLLTIPALMTILGASASGNPHAAVGAARELKLLLSYELPLFLVILLAIARAGWTFQLGVLAGHTPALYSISGVIAFVIAILCMQAKLGQIPFDMAEAECELMSGVYVEYSGLPLGMFLMARAMMLALLPLLLVMVFWGGLTLSGNVLHKLLGVAAFLGKYLLLVVLVVLIRNTNPRLRIDQTLRLFWYRLTPAAAFAVALTLVGISRGLKWL